MFAYLAPKLRDMGWKSLIPLHNPGKRPIIGQRAEDLGPLSSDLGPRTVDIFRLEVRQVHRPMF